MAVKDVELFVEEKRKNETLKAEWEEAIKEEANLREDQKENFFNENLYPIAKRYGFDFSFNDFCEYKNSSKPQDNDGELSDDELFDVAGGRSYAPYGGNYGPYGPPEHDGPHYGPHHGPHHGPHGGPHYGPHGDPHYGPHGGPHGGPYGPWR